MHGCLMVYFLFSDCQMKCHKDDIEKTDLIRPCVAGELFSSLLPSSCYTFMINTPSSLSLSPFLSLPLSPSLSL